MKKINRDYRDYILDMEKKEIVFIDPPWKYDDIQPGLRNQQLTYSLWENEVGIDFVFKNIKTDYLFLWCTNSMLEIVFRANHYSYKYKSMLTWVKTTKNGIAYGLGNSFRNCTEQLLLFTNKKTKPFRSKMRNLHMSNGMKRTIKPKELELKVIEHLILKSNNTDIPISYIFSGLEIDLFQHLNIDCVDIAF